MEIGLYTFADVATHPETKKTITSYQRILNLMEEIELADQVGLDVFAVGEPITAPSTRYLHLQ